MAVYRYKAVLASGKSTSGSLEANDGHEVVRLLSGKGLVVTQIARQGTALSAEKAVRAKLSPDDLVALLREWATLLSAGLTVDDALAICASGERPARVLAALNGLRRAVRDGQSLHAALTETGILPREAIVLVKAGEAAGALPRILERLASDFTQQRATQEGLITALLYPAVLLVTTLAAVAVIVLVVAPNLAELFESASGKPPARIAALLAFSDLIRMATPVLLALATFAGLAFVVMSRQERWRLVRDRLILRTPFMGAILRSHDTARFASAGALMIQCGVVPTHALPLAASAMKNGHLRQALADGLARAAHGMPLQEALSRSKALPSDMLALIDAGLRTGRLGDVLQHGGVLHAAKATSRVQRFSALLTPAITVFAGIVVGALAYLVLSAVVSLNEVAFQ